jgi:hypothetical protein
MSDEDYLSQVFDCREAFLRKLGQVDENLYSPLINPVFLGGPMWPSMRQSWRVVRRSNQSTIVCSDGLSDPFEDEAEPNIGFGLEILAETTDSLPEAPKASWLFEMVYDVSQQTAAHGGFRELIDNYGVVSMELQASPSLEEIANESGAYGVLLGIEPADWSTECESPAGGIKYATVKLLLPSELEYVVSNGKAGRLNLRDQFVKSGNYHRSSLTRPAVV